MQKSGKRRPDWPTRQKDRSRAMDPRARPRRNLAVAGVAIPSGQRGGFAMGVVMIRCPRTGDEVSTGLEMDQATWEGLPVVPSRMHCPACRAEHVWSRTYAR